ncbi:MAG TPA: hypothetical protein VMS01_01975 [Stellaceae bacterium]|nr:hypothetical protein [Stellaceae bacterium]
MNRYAASHYRGAGERARRGTAPPIDVSAELVTPRLSPLTSLIAVTVLSLAIWAGIWAVLRSLLWG